VALAGEVVSEDDITRPKTARGAIADPDFHLPRENKNVLPPGRGMPIAPIVRRETAEHEVGTRPKRNVLAPLGRQREIFKMGLAVVARMYPYDHADTPSHREHVSLTEDEALVSESIGTWALDKVHKAARRGSIPKDYAVYDRQVPVGQRYAGRNGMALLCDIRRYHERDRDWPLRCALEDLAGMVIRSPASLATDPIERVVVVMKDGAAREAPWAAVLFNQLARVTAGRKATVVAVL